MSRKTCCFSILLEQKVTIPQNEFGGIDYAAGFMPGRKAELLAISEKHVDSHGFSFVRPLEDSPKLVNRFLNARLSNSKEFRRAAGRNLPVRSLSRQTLGRSIQSLARSATVEKYLPLAL